MNEDSPVSDSTQSNDPKAKFLEALEKKKSKSGATQEIRVDLDQRSEKASRAQMHRRCSAENLAAVSQESRTKD